MALQAALDLLIITMSAAPRLIISSTLTHSHNPLTLTLALTLTLTLFLCPQIVAFDLDATLWVPEMYQVMISASP